jgi:uncharacterized protein (DUF924 family)
VGNIPVLKPAEVVAILLKLGFVEVRQRGPRPAASTPQLVSLGPTPTFTEEVVYQSVLQFWFQEISPAKWWKVDAEFDLLIAQRFSEVHRRATRSELFEWRAEPRGRLAEVIVLDQFSRNMYRGDRLAFATDTMALALAQEAVTAKADLTLSPEERVFLYMPYMHSESRVIHAVAQRLFKENAPKSNYDFELRHKAIIDRFGRYPHRNAALGRESTEEELEFLAQPGSSF